MTSPPSTPGASDRRASRRTATQRRALLHGENSEGAIAEGTVIEMSSSGLRINIGAPVFPGSVLELELYAGNQVTSATPDTLYVTVVRVVPEGGGRFTVGCTYANYPTTPRDATAPNISPTPTHARVRVVDSSTKPSASKKRSLDRRVLTVLLLLLLLIGTGTLVAFTASLMEQITGEPTNPLEEILEEQEQRQEPATTTPALTPSESINEISLDSIAFDEPIVIGDELDRGMAALYEGDFEEAREAFALAQHDEEASPAARAQAGIGLALAYATLGDMDAGTRSIEEVLRETSGAPAVWRDAGQRIDTLLRLGNPQGLPALMFAAGFELAPAPPGMNSDSAARLIVDRSGYTLTILTDGDPVATYPVGIGGGSTTPQGEFIIANKIRNPTWFNGGNPVPPGDPDNPLGDSWMGLGDDEGPTPVGIHPTQDRASIGANKSAGCIRMRPDDAAALFARCEIGTPVTIQ